QDLLVAVTGILELVGQPPLLDPPPRAAAGHLGGDRGQLLGGEERRRVPTGTAGAGADLVDRYVGPVARVRGGEGTGGARRDAPVGHIEQDAGRCGAGEDRVHTRVLPGTVVDLGKVAAADVCGHVGVDVVAGVLVGLPRVVQRHGVAAGVHDVVEV